MHTSEYLRRIRDHGQQKVSTRDFLVSVVVVILLLGAMGIYFMQAGHTPPIPSWLYVGVLLFVWVSAFLQLLRYGRRALPYWRVAMIVGMTFIVTSQFVPGLRRVDIIGMILLVCGFLLQWFEVTKYPISKPVAVIPTDQDS